MTVSTTTTTDLTVDQHITLALHLANFLHADQQPDAGQLALGKKFLFLLTQSVQIDGLVLRAKERSTLTLTASTAYVDADSDTLDIEGSGATVRGTDGYDHAIAAWTTERYQQQSDKTITGQPLWFVPEKRAATDQWRIYLYPVPSSDWTSLTVHRTRRLRDNDDGSATLDFDRRWYLAVQLWLQHCFARHYGKREAAGELRAEFDAEKDRVMLDETTRGDGMMTIPDTGWEGWT